MQIYSRLNNVDDGIVDNSTTFTTCVESPLSSTAAIHHPFFRHNSRNLNLSEIGRAAIIILSVISSGLYVRMYVSGVDSPVGWLVGKRKKKKRKKRQRTINVDSVAIGGSRKRNRVRITSAGLPYPAAIGRRNAGFLPLNVTIAKYGVDSSRRFAAPHSPPSPISYSTALPAPLTLMKPVLDIFHWKSCDRLQVAMFAVLSRA